MTDERIVNDLSDTKAPQHAVPQPQLGILPEVPKHQSACCPTPPVNPSSQTVSKPLGIQTQMVLGDTPSEVGPVPRLYTRLTPQDLSLIHI